MGFAQNFLKLLFGSQHEKDIKEMLPLLHKINSLESWAISLSKDDIQNKTEEFRTRLSEDEKIINLLPEAFAIAREAARRVLGERHYDVQLLGSISLHNGRIMEMKTGEGKTLSSVPASYLNSLTGKGVHVITVNDYLAERDAKWMKPVFEYLGVTVGAILPDMDNESRIKAYMCDITYGTNNEFGFDYLRDNMKGRMEDKVQRAHHYCIIDEIDSILVDEARTPLIISGQADDDTRKFMDGNRIAPMLTECSINEETGRYPDEEIDFDGDYMIEEKNKRIKFTNQGMNHIEEQLKRNNLIEGSLFSSDNFEYVHYLTQALRARLLFKKDVDYVVQGGKVEIVDEFTGRILHGRRYSEGLHQAIEAKERIQIARRNRTLATITFQNFFRMYDKISGMTGTADTEAKEFSKIYNLFVTVIPTNRPLARIDDHDIIYLNEKFKFEAICEEIAEVHKDGQPVLVGTVSIEKSELLSSLLKKKGIRHEVLNAKNHEREALIIAEAGAKGSVTIATNMAGRGTDIKLGGNPDFRARRKVGVKASPEEYLEAYEVELSKWRKDYEEVKSVGGLYIIGTERHESRRIDNQLRGRSGRQGDPGRSKFFISLDDDLMRLFGGENLKSMMGRMGMADGEPIYHKFISNAIEKAQTKVEDRNFDIRKHLLDYDDVLNEQRNFIYKQRDSILTDDEISKRILITSGELVSDIVDKYRDDFEFKYHDFMDQVREEFNILPDIDSEELEKEDDSVIIEKVKLMIQKNLQEKEKLVTNELFNRFLRFEYLKQVDKQWQDHLEQMEELREGVYLRSYGQKNPLQEYKREGFDIFEELIYRIRCDIARKAVKVEVVQKDGEKTRKAPTTIEQSHSSMSQFGGPKTKGGGVGNQKIQVKRNDPKVGRNDPCPCGSGKKYKQCCGKI